ncbi:MAG: hypothetical protein JO107_00130 [Hyphomicrobiales bacterium]|nr:hypothetical protein [Hyphomicrobiales bacterium]
MAGHTLTPWRIVKRMAVRGEQYFRIVSGNDSVVARTYGDSVGDEADASHIVKCVNAHDEMLAALRGIDAALCEGFDTQKGRMSGRRALIAVRAAIAKAEA